MSERPETQAPSEVVRAMEAEREAAERVAAARQEAGEIISQARHKARRIRTRTEARVSLMNRLVTERMARDAALIEQDLEARLKALEAEQVSERAYRAAAAAVAAALLGLEEGEVPQT